MMFGSTRENTVNSSSVSCINTLSKVWCLDSSSLSSSISQLDLWLNAVWWPIIKEEDYFPLILGNELRLHRYRYALSDVWA